MNDLQDPALEWLLRDAETQGPLLISTCSVVHSHDPISCYEKHYGVILQAEVENVHGLLEHDRPLFSDPNIGADPADIAAARESLTEAQAARKDPTAA